MLCRHLRNAALRQGLCQRIACDSQGSASQVEPQAAYIYDCTFVDVWNLLLFLKCRLFDQWLDNGYIFVISVTWEGHRGSHPGKMLQHNVAQRVQPGVCSRFLKRSKSDASISTPFLNQAWRLWCAWLVGHVGHRARPMGMTGMTAAALSNSRVRITSHKRTMLGWCKPSWISLQRKPMAASRDWLPSLCQGPWQPGELCVGSSRKG